MTTQGGYLYAAPMGPERGFPWSQPKVVTVPMYAAPMTPNPERPWPWPAPTPAPVGGLVETVRERLAQALADRSTLDAEIETLEKMLRAAGVET